MTEQVFYLDELNTNVGATLALLEYTPTESLNYDAIANIDIDYNILQNLFQFQTDSVDVNNDAVDDMHYKVVNSGPYEAIDFDTAATITSNAIAAETNNNLTYDYVRYLASLLFNTHLGVDLFTNETQMRDDLNTSSKANLNAVLSTLNDIPAPLTDADTTNNPARKLLHHILAADPGRFSALPDYRISQADTWYKMPIIDGDRISFVLNVSAATDQHTITGLADPIPDRKYLIQLHAITPQN